MIINLTKNDTITFSHSDSNCKTPFELEVSGMHIPFTKEQMENLTAKANATLMDYDMRKEVKNETYKREMEV